MSSIWFGDFRGRQLSYWLAPMKLSDKTFIVEDHAELSWAKVNAEDILTPNAITGTNVVFLLGFNDCLNSCTWKKINIDKIAEDYCEHVNSLIELFKEMTFYFCSVNPVTGPCPGTNYKGDLIPADVLNDAINRFNAKIKEKCKAIYIDSHSYLINTHFSTRDGIRFTQDTCESLLMFLVGCMKNEYTGTFTPRLTMPDFGPIANEEGDGDSDMINNYNLYLTSQGKYGGLNPYPPNNKYARFKGDTLPNCTAWAWGRFYEILGEKPNLALDYAERWWNYTKDGYKRGQTPALGAVICWQSGPTDDEEPTVEDGAGHVAIVEQINPDGSIIVSESGWEEEEYWWTTKRDSYGYWSNRTGKYIPTGDNTWGYIEFKFQGFIYCPVTVAVSKEEIRDVNAWSAFSVDEEMKKNAQYIWQYFGSRGWSVNAVAALLGNLQSESGMSPSIWESVIEGSIINSDGTHSLNTPVLEEYKKNEGRYPGYGLVQWTPYTKYTDWCTSGGRNFQYWDIDSQLERINWEAENGVQWGLAHYNKDFIYKDKAFASVSFKDFITSTEDPNWLAAAFALCYERPGASSPGLDENGKDQRLSLCELRGSRGDNWYTFLTGLLPSITDAKLRIEELKVNKQQSTEVQISFLAYNIDKAKYTLVLEEDYKESGYDDVDDDSGIKIDMAKAVNKLVMFDIKNLIPNKKYVLILKLEDKAEEKITKNFVFSTAQEFPETVKSVKLNIKERRFPQNTVQIEITPNKPNFGYWKNKKRNRCGYAIQLIVNSRIKEEIEVSELPEILKLSKYFKYNPSLTDTIQIGIRTWVLDDDNKVVYNNKFATVSKPICGITKPVTAYINNIN